MIEPFEAALADVLADRVALSPDVQIVTRPTGDRPALVSDRARLTVAVVDARAGDGVGADRVERVGPAGLRVSLRLTGQVRVTVEVAAGAPGPAAAGRRAALWRAADAVLVALHDDDLRTGVTWGDSHQQGFAIDRFRLSRVTDPDAASSGPEPEPPAEPGRRLEIWCEYAGRFWPTEPVAEGDLIEAPVRTRMVVLDMEAPAEAVAQSGGGDLVVPVTIDLAAWGGAEPRLVARLRGAAPPGQLIGDAAGVPPGSVGYLPGDDGRFGIRFRAAGGLAAPAVARVLLSLAAADRPTVRVGELRIDVRP